MLARCRSATLVLLVAAAATCFACGGAGPAAQGPDAGADAPAADTRGLLADASGNETGGDGFTGPDSGSPATVVQVFEETSGAGLSSAATGSFDAPAFEYEPVPVGAEFVHLLNFQMTPFMPPWRKPLRTHGPLILYSDELDTIVFSPLDNPFSSIVWFEDGAIHYGINGEVDSTPTELVHRFVLVKGRGINATVAAWGSALLQDRGKSVAGRYDDVGLSKLSYWTDNGGYYYYNTEEGLNEQDTLLAVKADLDARQIPVGAVQLDSWWYFKDGTAGLWPPAGLLLWEPIPEMFPDGLEAFSKAVGVPLIAHNRWFATNNLYLDQYDFVVEEEMAIPTGPGVFQEFMANAKQWGIATYEQDWIASQYWGLKTLREAPGRTEAWMGWMDDAASQQGLTMQLCMGLAAGLVDSVDRKSVTTVRTSTDYHLDVSKESYWPQFHILNMLAMAVGIQPFKDNFQSSEKHGEAEALVSVLSGGMVGFSDAVGKSQRGILMRTCRSDGTLLKPDRGAVPVDAMFLDHGRPFTTVASSVTEGLGRTTYVAAYNISRDHPERTAMDRAWAMLSYEEQDLADMFVYPALVTEWGFDLVKDAGVEGEVVLYDWRAGTASRTSGAVQLTAMEHLYDWTLLVLSPIASNGLALIGEPGKYVTLADRRFQEVTPLTDGFEVVLAGSPGEVVEILVFDATADALLPAARVVIPAGGTGTVVVGR